MFEFLILNNYFDADEVIKTNNTPIHIAAVNTMQSSMNITIRQFNEACEAICYE